MSAWDAWVGGRFRLALPIVPINGFAIYNTGDRQDYGNVPEFHHDGVALKLEAGPVCDGPGKFSGQALYSTGGDTSGGGFRTVAQSARDNFGAEGYWSYLMLVSPQGYSDVNDMGVSLQNRGCGLITVETKYDYPILKRLSGTIAVGWLRSDTPNPANGSTDMGTEIGNDFTLDFGGGLKADMGAAVSSPATSTSRPPALQRPPRCTRRSAGCNWSSDSHVRVCRDAAKMGMYHNDAMRITERAWIGFSRLAQCVSS